MAQGQVSVTALNLIQGEFKKIEGTLLFIGEHDDTELHGDVLSVNAATDFDEVLGSADSDLKSNMEAAQLNGKQNWFAYLITMPADATQDDYFDAIDDALETELKAQPPEGLIVFDEVVEEAEVKAWHAKVVSIQSSKKFFMFAVLAAPGIDPDNESWAEYHAAIAPIVADVAANRVGVVPQLHGNDLGMLAGRLCDHSITLADSPMRVETGPVLGLGETPVDKNDKPLSDATLKALDNARFSCIQHYPAYPGTYFGDLNILDVPAGDYLVIENVRVMLKVSRQIYALAVARIADRRFNSTPASIEFHKTYFARPMREMSKSIEIDGRTYVGELKPPKEDAVNILWETRTKVKLFVKACPYGSAKTIDAFIILDLTTLGA